MFTIYAEDYFTHNVFTRDTLEEAKALADKLAEKYESRSPWIVVTPSDNLDNVLYELNND